MAGQSHLKFSWRTEVGKCSSISQEVCQNCHPSRHNQPATCHTKLEVSKNDRKHWSPADVDMEQIPRTVGPVALATRKWMSFSPDDSWECTRFGGCTEVGSYPSHVSWIKNHSNLPKHQMAWVFNYQNCLMNWNPGRLMFLFMFIWSCSEELPWKDMLFWRILSFFGCKSTNEATVSPFQP